MTRPTRRATRDETWHQAPMFPDDPVGSEAARALAEFRTFARFVSIDPTQNRARFYVLSWQPGLWDNGALVVHWGRIGTEGRELPSFYANRDEAQPVIERAIRRRLRRGYRMLEVA